MFSFLGFILPISVISPRLPRTTWVSLSASYLSFSAVF